MTVRGDVSLAPEFPVTAGAGCAKAGTGCVIAGTGCAKAGSDPAGNDIVGDANSTVIDCCSGCVKDCPTTVGEPASDDTSSGRVSSDTIGRLPSTVEYGMWDELPYWGGDVVSVENAPCVADSKGSI